MNTNESSNKNIVLLRLTIERAQVCELNVMTASARINHHLKDEKGILYATLCRQREVFGVPGVPRRVFA
jgi:hypothetical protein